MDFQHCLLLLTLSQYNIYDELPVFYFHSFQPIEKGRLLKTSDLLEKGKYEGRKVLNGGGEFLRYSLVKLFSVFGFLFLILFFVKHTS